MGLEDRDYMKSDSWQREQRQRLAAWQWRTHGTRPRTGRRPRLLQYGLAAVLVLGVGGAAGYAVAVKVSSSSEDTPVISWAGESFASEAQFKLWFAEHGSSYAAWAKKHPAAAAKLESHPQP